MIDCTHRTVRWLAALGLFSVAFSFGDLRATAESSEASDHRRYALIVANNASVDPDVDPLEFADDDGARYYELFDSFADRTALLTRFDSESRRIFPEVADEASPPSRAQLDRAVERLATEIAEARDRDATTELYLVFTGHGNVDDDGDGYLSLEESKLRRSELYRDVIRRLDADYTHLVVDACHAYHMVHTRGGGDEWEDDRSGETLDRQLDAYLAGEGDGTSENLRSVGVIVSTAGTAEVHEWSRYRAGVFSHQLRSGLLGAADADSDGSVTYRELEAYLAAANAAVTNPKARIDVYAHPPDRDRSRAITSLSDFEAATILEIPAGTGGRYYLEDSRGLRYADFHVAGTSPTRIAMLRSPLEDEVYYLNREDRQAKVPLEGLTVQSSELAFRETSNQSRGSVDEAFRNNLFETAYGPSFVAGYRAGQSSRRASGPAAAANPSDPDHWSLVPSVSYGASSGLADLYDGKPASRLEHHLDVRAIFRHTSGWGVGPFVSYGAWFPGSKTVLHRFSGGIEGSYRFRAAPRLAITPALRLGHTGYLLGGDQLRSDPLGLRTEATASAAWQLGDRVRMYAAPGVAANLYTVDPADGPNREEWFVSPMARLGIEF